MADINLSSAIYDLKNAVYGEEVRDALVRVAEAVQYMVNNQVIDWTDIIPDDSSKRRGHINSGDLNTYYGDNYLGLWTVNTIRDDQPNQVAHVPSGASGAGWLAIYRLNHTTDHERCLQIYIETAITPVRVSWRLHNENGWQDWERVITSTEWEDSLSKYLSLTAAQSTVIPDGTDWDTITTPGAYRVTSRDHILTMTNTPPMKVGGKLIVSAASSADRAHQIWLASTFRCDIAYIRVWGGTTWSDWYTFSMLENMRSRFAGTKVSIIGDSIETFNWNDTMPSGYATYYPNSNVPDVKYLEDTWWMQVINASGSALEVNASWSGSCASNVKASGGYPDFYDRVRSIGSPDLIFVALGTNDSNESVAMGEYDFETAYSSLSEATFRTAYIKGVKALQALYPSAKIVCVIERMGENYKSSIKHIADTLGVEYVDVSDYVAVSGNHPGKYGMRQISSKVLSVFESVYDRTLKDTVDNGTLYTEYMGYGESSGTYRTVSVNLNTVTIVNTGTSTGTFRCWNLFGAPEMISDTWALATLEDQTFYPVNLDSDALDLTITVEWETQYQSQYNRLCAATKNPTTGEITKATIARDDGDKITKQSLFELLPEIKQNGNFALFIESRHSVNVNRVKYWLQTRMNDILDYVGYYMDHSSELIYHADSISGTRNVQTELALPAGTYRITADRYTSSDTDRAISRIIFNQAEGDSVNVNLDRDTPIDQIVVLPAASAHFTAYASITATLSTGDSFTITNFSIGRVVTNPVTESIEAIVDTGEYVKYSGTIIGTNSVQTALNLTPGAYRITADSLVSSDTDETTSLILFNQAEGDAKAVYVERGVPIDEIVVLPAASARFTVYASRKADVSAGDTFTALHFKISKILDGLLPEKVDELADKFDYLVDTGGGVKYSGTISGKYYVQTALPLPAGTYRITADSFVSSDTDEERSLILFNQDSEGVANKAVYVKRDVPIDEIVKLTASSLRFTVYASRKADVSAGDTFTVTNLKIAKQLEANDAAAGRGNGGYHDLPKNPYPLPMHKVWNPDKPEAGDKTMFTEVISTTHAHGTNYDPERDRIGFMAREYEHVAISNYYPSVPWYPLEAHYETVPEGFMASPNSEQVHFTGLDGHIHICAVGSWLCRDSYKNEETIEECIADIVNTLQFPQAGGVTINHPKWTRMSAKKSGGTELVYPTPESFENFIIDLLDNTRGIFGMEIYNAGCEWNNNHQGLGLDTYMWDGILSTGRQIFGLAVPDHWLEMAKDADGDYETKRSQGFGYNHVIVRSKTEQEILLAYAYGRFYASIKNTDLKFLNLCYTAAGGFEVETSKSCDITFITSNGRVLTVTGTSVVYVPTGDDVFVRVEATDGDNTLYSNAVIL